MIKGEVRVLIVNPLSRDLLIYIVQRGIRGVEHIGLVSGGVTNLINHLNNTNLMDEIRYIVLPDNNVIKICCRGRRITKASNDEVNSLTNMISEGRRVLDMVISELKLITTQSENTL